MDRWSNKYVDKLTKGDALTHYLATRLVEQAETNLLTSTNLDGSRMTTNKATGEPLIDTGAMLGSIARVDNAAIVNVPYAATVQQATGNRFIGRPPARMLGTWLGDFLSLT